MLTIAAKAARYFTVAVYALVCLWFVFGIGSVSAAGGFLVAVPVLLVAFGKVARWNNIVAAAYYDCRISESRNSALTRAITAVIAAAIDGAIAYLFYYLSTRVGDASPWWYVWLFLMADTLFVAWSNVFCAVFALDAAGGQEDAEALTLRLSKREGRVLRPSLCVPSVPFGTSFGCLCST